MTKSILPWFLWGLATFFYIFQYVLRVCPSIMLPNILARYGINAAQFGTFSGIHYLGYALAHIPIGLFMGRIGPKKLISFCALLSAIGIIPLIYSHNWQLAVLGRFVMGIGSSGAILGVFNVIRTYFPQTWFSQLLGISVTLGILGLVSGRQVVHYLIMTTNLENIFFCLMIIGFFISCLIFIFTPSHQSSNELDASIRSHLKAIYENKKIIWTAIFAALMVGPLEGFADVWGVSFFQSVYHFNRAQAITLPSFIFVGMCIGSLILPFIAEKYKLYKKIILTASIGMAILFSLILFGQFNIIIIKIIMIFIGVLSAYKVLAIYLNGLNAQPAQVSLVTSFTNMIIMSFGYIFHTLIGKTIQLTWNGNHENSIPVYESSSYIYALMIIPIALIIAFFGFLTLGFLKNSKVSYKGPK